MLTLIVPLDRRWHRPGKESLDLPTALCFQTRELLEDAACWACAAARAPWRWAGPSTCINRDSSHARARAGTCCQARSVPPTARKAMHAVTLADSTGSDFTFICADLTFASLTLSIWHASFCLQKAVGEWQGKAAQLPFLLYPQQRVSLDHEAELKQLQ